MSRHDFTSRKLFFKGYGISLRRSRDGEYRVCHAALGEAYAYYTDDFEDAIGTADEMLKKLTYSQCYEVVITGLTEENAVRYARRFRRNKYDVRLQRVLPNDTIIKLEIPK